MATFRNLCSRLQKLINDHRNIIKLFHYVIRAVCLLLDPVARAMLREIVEAGFAKF